MVMTDELRNTVLQWINDEISREEFLTALPGGLSDDPDELRALFQDVLQTALPTDVSTFLYILREVEKDHQHTRLLNQLMLVPWHGSYEEIVHMLQQRKDPASIPYIRKAMQQQYPALVSYGTGIRQLINQCGWALYVLEPKKLYKPSGSCRHPQIRC